MRQYLIFVIVLCLALGGCAVFRLPTVQGNVIDQKQVDQLEIGMTPEQVRFLLGSPLLQDSFDSNHWDYVYYYRSPRGKVTQRNLNLYFESERLARIVGAEQADGKGKPAASANEELQKTREAPDPKAAGATESSTDREDGVSNPP